MFKFAESQIKQDLAEELREHVFGLAKDPYGTRILQKVIKNCEKNSISFIISELKSNVIKLAKDPNGI